MTSTGDRNILINSQLKRILFISNKKKWNTTEKDKKNMEKNKTDGSDLLKMRYQIQILWRLLNLNERQTWEMLTVVAVIMWKKVQKQLSRGILQLAL